MVSSNERRNRREYSLRAVRDLARQGSVIYGSARVQRHIENLGYEPKDVHNCLACLEECHYRGTVRYENSRIWMDEYLISFSAPSGQIDDLYIKLKLNRDCVLIVLASFHPEGWV